MALESRIFTYEAELEWRGGRRGDGHGGRPPGARRPAAARLPRRRETSWSPEHLFLASIQSCTMLSFVAHCAHHGLEIVSYRSTADGIALAERRSPLRLPDRLDGRLRAHVGRPRRGRPRADAEGRAGLLHLGLHDRRGLDRLEDHRMTPVRCAVDGRRRVRGRRRGVRGRGGGRPSGPGSAAPRPTSRSCSSRPSTLPRPSRWRPQVDRQAAAPGCSSGPAPRR